MLLPTETRYRYAATTRSNEELLERIENRQRYMPETIEASIAELQSRQYEFSDEELKIIGEDLRALRANAALVGNARGVFSREYKNVIVEDPDAPQLYSRMSVNIFTVLFGAFFGSVMMSMNLSRFGKSKEAVWVVAGGVAFTAMQYVILSNAHGSNSSIQIILGFAAAYLMDFFFWKPYIGYDTFYRKRPIWAPLIIALVIVGLIVFSIISNTNQ